MPRSIEEIQRDLAQSEENINAIAKQSGRIEQGLQFLNEQERAIAGRALAPTQIENRKLLTELHGSMSSMEREIGSAAADLKGAYEELSEIDVKSINQSTRGMNELLKLADPERRQELIIALDEAYKERKSTLEKAYEEQKAEFDKLIDEKREKADQLEEKYKSLNIKRIVRNTIIAMLILFLLAFAIRWGTLFRNKISVSSAQTEQTSTEEEKAVENDNKGLLDWLFPSDND